MRKARSSWARKRRSSRKLCCSEGERKSVSTPTRDSHHSVLGPKAKGMGFEVSYNEQSVRVIFANVHVVYLDGPACPQSAGRRRRSGTAGHVSSGRDVPSYGREVRGQSDALRALQLRAPGPATRACLPSSPRNDRKVCRFPVAHRWLISMAMRRTAGLMTMRSCSSRVRSLRRAARTAGVDA